MSMCFYRDFRIGVLGGGQLGQMLIQSGIGLNIPFAVMDPSALAPCRGLADFTVGDLMDYEAVMRFGRRCDTVTIEIENINAQALADLKEEGKEVYPPPEVVEIIQDKRRQKRFFSEKGIPTAEFVCTQNREDAMRYKAFLPAAHKQARAGYDGRGVRILHDINDLKNAFDAPAVLEKKVDIDKEIAVIVARNRRGDIVSYPLVEMRFYPRQNILDRLVAPACVPARIAREAEAIARDISKTLRMVGVLAIEMFLTTQGAIKVNEMAPRPHNSGHHTIEACPTSQYAQHLRAILNQPLGAVAPHAPSAMINLLGQPGHQGAPVYRGLEEVLAVQGAHIHLYGKSETRPFRKMGHVTVVDHNRERLEEKTNFVQQQLRVTT